VTVVDKLTLMEALITALLGTICLLARWPLHASRTNGRLIRLERLRRSRWQWFSMVVLMFLLRIQHVLPARVELVVGLQFLIFLVLPIRGLVRKTGMETASASAHDFSPQCDLQSITCAAPQP
jgi:hypothetical protein